MPDTKVAEAADTGAEAKTYTPEESQALINQLREENKAKRLDAEALTAKLNNFIAAQEKAESDRLAAEGKFKELYETANLALQQRTTEAEQAKSYQDAFKATLAARIAAIPEGMRSLVPDDLDPIKLSQWLDKNALLLKTPRAPNLDAGAGGAAGSLKEVALSAEEIQAAKNMRITPERYAARKAESLLARGKPQEQ